MKLITQFEAATRTATELHGLCREALNVLSVALRGSQERCNALASLDNIQRELALR